MPAQVGNREANKYERKSPQIFYRITLYQQEDGITAAKLGEPCRKDKADVPRMTSVLEKKGLLRKKPIGGICTGRC